ncbi:MAG: hypothetical protein GY862_07250, partial [Gammaproteobacteria bacterium]|nr:hypothetical protein [Gammaproteobacteria bacterium]
MNILTNILLAIPPDGICNPARNIWSSHDNRGCKSAPAGVHGFSCIYRTLLIFILLAGFLSLARAGESIPEGLETGEWRNIQQQIRTAEYHPAPTESGDYTAPNRAQGLYARFGKDGRVQVTPAAAQPGLSLRLTAYGYGDKLRPVPPAGKPVVKKNRVEYRRGDLTEWYVNDARGIEQGFTLEKPPVFLQGASQNELPLRLALTLDGSLISKLSADTQTVTFKNAGGRTVFNYDKLHVMDARGQTVAAHFELLAAVTADGRDNRTQLHILAEDAGAVYPLVIDPLITGEQEKFNRLYVDARDWFGTSAALDENTLLVGAPRDESCALVSGCPAGGAVYVFMFNGTDWNQHARLTASDAAAGDGFGVSVALSGDTALIGAIYDDDGGVDSGSAYMFTRSGTVWSQQQKLTADDTAEDDLFGWSVALSDDTALIGAYRADAGGSNTGSAYVFTRSGTVWSQQAKLTAGDAAAGDLFGYSVALSGDTALIGAYMDDSSGSAYVFIYSGTAWSQQAKLTASDAAWGDNFGRSVALNGNTALVGANRDDDGGSDSGSAYVFTRNSTVWSQQAKLTASDAAADDHFGYSVALNDDAALIGAYWDDDSGDGSGSAYVFTHNGTAWSQQTKLTASDAMEDDQFGWSVALFGDVALIGAYLDDDGGYDSGSAYVFTRNDTAWSQQKLSANDAAVDDLFGISAALSGDTALIGASEDGDGDTNFGSAYVFTRSGMAWSQQARLTPGDATGDDYFGYSVALSGDTALIGAYWNDDGGSAYVFTHSGTVWSQQAKLTASDTGEFGYSVALSGDTALVGDSLDEVTYVFTRSGTIWSQQQKLIADDAVTKEFGYSVALSGDTALIGASWDDGGGSAYVFTRSGTVWSQQAKLTVDDAADGVFGTSVALSGDTALIGAPEDDYGDMSWAGSVYVFTRSGTVWSQQAKLIASDAAEESLFGSSVALSGDTALIGAEGDEDDSDYLGSAYVFIRSGADWSQQRKLTAGNAAAHDEFNPLFDGDAFGHSVALSGNTVLIGAQNNNEGGDGSGSAYVFDVAFVNEAPDLRRGDTHLLALTEDSSENHGTSITDLIASATDELITDTDTDTIFDYEGIVVTAADTTGNGVWQYRLDNRSWTNFEVSVETAALLLAADGNTFIRFKRNDVANFNTARLQVESKPLPSIGFRAWDQTNACHFSNAEPVTCKSNGDTDDVSANGGATPYSTATETVHIMINPIADTPSVTSAATLSNKQTTEGLEIFRNPVDGDEVTHFKISDINGGELFQNNGSTPIRDGEFISFAQGNAGLRFTPDSQEDGYFTVEAATVNDDIGIGGESVTATINVLSLSVTLHPVSFEENAAGNFVPVIQGTAHASPNRLDRVEIAIRDLQNNTDAHFNKDGDFSGFEPASELQWVQAAGTESWEFIEPVIFLPGNYEVWTRAADQMEPKENISEEKSRQFTVTCDTKLSLFLNRSAILQNDPLNVAGKLSLVLCDGELPGETIDLKVSYANPEDNTEYPFASPLSIESDSLGNFIFELPDNFFNLSGVYTLTVSFTGDGFQRSSSSSVNLWAGKFPGYAVLVQGKLTNDEGLKAHGKTLGRVYNHLKQKDFEDDHIRYFAYEDNPGVDAVPAKAAIQEAVESWACGLISGSPAPFYLIMVDHGSPGGFFITGSEIITPEDVNAWLNKLEICLEESANGAVAVQKPRMLVVGACYSGSFIPAVSKLGRIIVTSAAASEVSYKGLREDDGIRSGEFFIEEFFLQLARGVSLKQAFGTATESTEAFTRHGHRFANTANPFLDDAMQHPLLDDNGDGVGSNMLSAGSDGQPVAGRNWSAESLVLGAILDYDTNAEDNPADIKKVTETLFLEASESSARLFLQAYVAGKVDPAIVAVRSPSQILRAESGTEQAEIELDRRFPSYNEAGSRFEITYNGFAESGLYEIFYTVRDKDSGNISPIRRSAVYKNRAGNRAPDPVALHLPANGDKAKTVLILDWKSAKDPDGDPITYTLTIAEDENFDSVKYHKEGLTSSWAYVDDHANLEDDTGYFWKVTAVDSFGTRTDSEIWSFHTNNPGAPYTIASMDIYSAVYATPLPEASVVFQSASSSATAILVDQYTGTQAAQLFPDTYQAVVNASGYQQVQLAIKAVAGETIADKVFLEPECPPNCPRHGILEFVPDQPVQVREDEGAITLSVQRVDGFSGDVSVHYTLTGDSADANDFDNNDGVLHWADTDSRPQPIVVSVYNDTEYEGENETFTITLLDAQGGANVGTLNNQIEVAIIDDETQQRGKLQFLQASYTADEGIDTATLTVERAGGTDGELSENSF